MRKLLIAAIAAVTALAVAGVALAANVYELTESSTFKRGKGTPSNPVPKGVAFDYTVKDEAGPRGKPVKTYKIQFQGLTHKYQNRFPQCKFSQTDDDAPLATIMQRCRKAKIGEGRVESLVAIEATNPGPGQESVALYANLQLTLFNIPGGISIRLDADTPPPDSQDGPFGAPVPTHAAINARHRNVRIGGVPSSSLEFDVPEELRHNSGLEITVARTSSQVDRLVKRVRIKGKRRKVGFYSAIGCAKNGRRLVRVTFVDETGDSTNSTGSGPC
jgi:hypothetical protein